MFDCLIGHPSFLRAPIRQVKAWTPADARLHWGWKSFEEGYVVKVGKVKYLRKQAGLVGVHWPRAVVVFLLSFLGLAWL